MGVRRGQEEHRLIALSAVTHKLSSVRARRRRRRRRSRNTWLRYALFSTKRRRWTVYSLGGLIGLGLLWILITGFFAARQAAALETRLAQVRVLVAQGRISDARTVARDIPAMASRAHRLTTGPAWWIGSEIPYLGRPLDVTRQLTAAADDVGSTVVPELIKVASTIDPNAMRASGRTVRLAPLIAVGPSLRKSAAILDRVDRHVRSIDSGSWLSSVDSRRDKFAAQIEVIRGYTDAAARASRVLPGMLGNVRTQRYFIGLQNEAELRGTGGLPGAFAIATVDRGTIRFTRFASDAVLLPAKTAQRLPTGLDFGKEYTAAYGVSDPTASYVDSNVSPNFPYAAQIWATMYERVSKQHIDGVVAVDPTTLSYFLQALGPVRLPQGGIVTAYNVVSLTEKDEYSIFSDNTDRKNFLVSVLKATATKLTSGAGGGVALVQAASRSASEHRLLVWTRDSAAQHALEQTSYAGQIPNDRRSFAGLVINNAAAGKLDYYLSRSINYARTGCGSRRDVVVTVTLTNAAPASGLSPYVTTRLDKNPPPTAKPGDNRELVDYYATYGALLQSVTLNGRPTTASELPIDGHPVFRLDLELPRGTTQTIVLHLEEPAGSETPRIWRQPGVTPLAVQEFHQPCS